MFIDAEQITLQRKLLFSLKSHKDYPQVGNDGDYLLDGQI